MGYLEAAVVVYLRRLFHPDGFRFPLHPIPVDLAITEIGREASTVVMMAAVAWQAGPSWKARWGAFMIVFGVWDIFYYIWLKILIGWPSGLLDPDILFLIPLPWVGPVLAPVGVSVMLILLGWLYFPTGARAAARAPAPIEWTLLLGGSALILWSFLEPNWGMADFTRDVVYPERYPWELYLAGIVLGAMGGARLRAREGR